ncbi:MAG: hypothetical protein WDA47_04660 [Bacilli bacterium]
MRTNSEPGRKGIAYCNFCKKETEIAWEDVGIGPYEYWGGKGVDFRVVPICSECGEEVDEKTINFYEIDQLFLEEENEMIDRILKNKEE